MRPLHLCTVASGQAEAARFATLFTLPYSGSAFVTVDNRALAKEEAILKEKMKVVDEDVSGTLTKTGTELKKEADAAVEEAARAAAAEEAEKMKAADDVDADQDDDNEEDYSDD